MTLGERIKACRQAAGLSQEMVADRVGVSRQAVTKWEADQSAPSAEHLLQLAQLFGTTAELLPHSGDGDAGAAALARQVCTLLQREEENKRRQKRRARSTKLLAALAVAGGYLLLYLAGRTLWCGGSATTLLGWLALNPPMGEHSYLFGWLLHSRLFWYSMAISTLPALFGRCRFSACTLAGFALGLLLGILLGPNPAGAPYGHGHYGWAIWGGIYLASLPAGAALEYVIHRRNTARKERAET